MVLTIWFTVKKKKKKKNKYKRKERKKKKENILRKKIRFGWYIEEERKQWSHVFEMRERAYKLTKGKQPAGKKKNARNEHIGARGAMILCHSSF